MHQCGAKGLLIAWQVVRACAGTPLRQGRLQVVCAVFEKWYPTRSPVGEANVSDRARVSGRCRGRLVHEGIQSPGPGEGNIHEL